MIDKNEEKLKKMFEIYLHIRKKYLNITFEYFKNKVKNGFIICGVGKNWYVAEKITKTFISLGINCQSLDCTHALHGDVGMINNQNIIFISKSGTTNELNTLINYIVNLRKNNICNPTLTLFCLNDVEYNDLDLIINLKGLYKYEDMLELDNNNLVPTISINILQLFLDELGIKLFENDKNKIKRYKYNHPSGKIGEILNV